MIRHALALLALLALAAPAAAQSMRTAESAPAMAGFGVMVAVSEDQVLVAEPNDVRAQGAVYVYGKQSGSWTEVGRLTAENGARGNLFGVSLATSGERVIVGAPAQGGAGAAYVFQRDGDSWRQVARLTASGGASDSLGSSVAIDGNLAIVGAGGADSARGAVYVFRADRSGRWTEAGRIAAPAGSTPDDRFGDVLALHGTSAIVAAARADSGRGAVYVYGGDGWTQQARIAPDSLTANARFGSAIKVGEDVALIGAPGFNGFRGAVHVYRPEGSGWTHVGPIPFQGMPQERFGSSIAISRDEVWIGAPGADRFNGAIYSLAPGESGANGVAPTKLTLIDSLPQGGAFGGALALGESVAAVGLPGEDFGMGSAAVFDRSGESWTLASRVESETTSYLAEMVGSPVTCENGKIGEFSCSQVDLVSFVPVSQVGGGRGVRLSGVWGWTDPDTGKEYALLGRMDGTSFVDISDPTNPVYLGDLPKTEGSQGAIWREIKVYKNHAYIVADGAGAHGMQVFDLTRLREVPNAPATFTVDAHYTRIQSAHNIVINEDSGFAYATGSNGGDDTCGGGLHMIDIRDPENPQFSGCFADPSTGRQKTGYTHDAQCVTYRGPDEEHRGREICLNSNETALSIADVTDKQNPVALAMAEYPNVGYTHQGWLTEDQRYLFMDDELDEMNGLVENTRTLVWDLSDL
ncbi:MAG TPA: choice-of-anchor B family protein, partial [Gemmatimonadota bacterium]|nr:choice-of-anchor B family protein [Gemmatimonadota bacterium]